MTLEEKAIEARKEALEAQWAKRKGELLLEVVEGVLAVKWELWSMAPTQAWHDSCYILKKIYADDLYGVNFDYMIVPKEIFTSLY